MHVTNTFARCEWSSTDNGEFLSTFTGTRLSDTTSSRNAPLLYPYNHRRHSLYMPQVQIRRANVTSRRRTSPVITPMAAVLSSLADTSEPLVLQATIVPFKGPSINLGSRKQ